MSNSNIRITPYSKEFHCTVGPLRWSKKFSASRVKSGPAVVWQINPQGPFESRVPHAPARIYHPNKIRASSRRARGYNNVLGLTVVASICSQAVLHYILATNTLRRQILGYSPPNSRDVSLYRSLISPNFYSLKSNNRGAQCLSTSINSQVLLMWAYIPRMSRPLYLLGSITSTPYGYRYAKPCPTYSNFQIRLDTQLDWWQPNPQNSQLLDFIHIWKIRLYLDLGVRKESRF